MIRDLGESLSDAVLRRIGRGSARVQEQTPLPVDLLESDDAYLAVFDAPGATASDVQVRYANRRVFVRIDRFRSFREGFEMRFPGRGLSLDGEIQLPSDAVVAGDAASATLTERGTLEVELPRRKTDSDTSAVSVQTAGDDSESMGDDGEAIGDDDEVEDLGVAVTDDGETE